VHSSKTWRIGLLAAVWAAAAAVASAAEPGGFQAPSAGDRLRANEPSTLSWSIEPDALAERDEMELVLSLDGGATFPIRVTGELSPGSRTLSWRVPALPTGHAVLALRAGDDGESETETILAVSEPFAIAADPEAAPELLYPVAEEWRTRDALDGAPVRATPRDLAPSKGGPEIFSADSDTHESEAPSLGGETERAEAGDALNTSPPPSPRAASRRISRSLPLPLRL